MFDPRERHEQKNYDNHHALLRAGENKSGKELFHLFA